MKCCFHPYLPGNQRQNGQRQKKLKCIGVQYFHNGAYLSANNDQFGMKGKTKYIFTIWPFPSSFMLKPKKGVLGVSRFVLYRNVKKKTESKETQMKNMRCGGVWLKAPSAWLTYIGSLLLTSHSHQHRPAHIHTPYPLLRKLCSLMPHFDSLSSPFPLPRPFHFHPLCHLRVVRYEQYVSESCGAMLEWKIGMNMVPSYDS